jgi:hypothetical protein
MPVAGGPNITKTGILLEVDAADKTSYSGTGTTWTNQVRPGTFNGTLNNISFDSNDSRGALVFTGSNTFVDFGNLGPSLTSSFSFQVAFKPAATASGQPYTILSYASASATSSITFKLDYTSSNQTVVLTTFAGTGSQNIVYAISASAASGSWNVVHGTFGSQLAALYVNGLGQAYAPTTGSVVGYNTSNRLYAGLNFGSIVGYFTGSVANITVNNADLDGLTVNKNYNALASRFSLPVRRPTVTDADAFAFVEAAGISDPTQQLAVNTLVLGLKSNNLWTKMQVIYPFIGGTAYSHKFNLKNTNTFTATFYGDLTHTSFGAGSGSITGYIDPNFIDITNFSNISSSAHVTLYGTTTNAVAGVQVPVGNTNQRTFSSAAGQGINFQSNNYFYGNPSAQIYGAYMGVGNSRGLGLNVLSRTGVASSAFYYRRPSDSTTSTDSTTFGRNAGGNILNGGRILFLSGLSYPNTTSTLALGFASIGEGLSQTDVENLYTLVQAYQTALGRQVS